MATSPLRTCIATGQTLPKAQLLRFVADAAGNVHHDINHKAQGRSAYCVAQRAAVQKAVTKQLFTRHIQAQAPANLANQVAQHLTQSLIAAIGLTKKASTLCIGADKCAEQKSKYILLATDASANTKASAAKYGAEVLQLLTKTQMEDATAVPNCTVVGTQKADLMWAKACKLAQYEGEHTHD